jgi:hypothetical protein
MPVGTKRFETLEVYITDDSGDEEVILFELKKNNVDLFHLAYVQHFHSLGLCKLFCPG